MISCVGALALAVAAGGGGATPLPRFEAHGQEAGALLMGVSRPSAQDVAAEVRRRGFYAGDPIGAGDCSNCHGDVAAQWASSAHRFSSFNNPYYRFSVEEFRRQ